MEHVAHVRLVDAHAKRVRCDHDGRIVADERLLVCLALGSGEPGMVARRADACRHERIADGLGVLPGGAVHDARIARVLQGVGGDPRELSLGICALDGEVQVRSVEPGDDAVGVEQPEQAHDVVANALGGRRRKRADGGARGQLRDEGADLQIRRAEVLAPLRHAMGLVDGDERYARAARKLDEARIFEPFGCYIYDVELACSRALDHTALGCGRKRRVEIGRVHPCLHERADLIAH